MNLVKIEQKFSLTRWPIGFAILLTMLVSLFTVPAAEAKLGNAGNCLGCHTEKNPSAQVTFSLNGTTVALTATPTQNWNHEGTINVTPGQTFEIDFLYTGVLRNNSDNPAVIYPPGSTWVANGGTVPSAGTGKGTGLVTDLANWSTWWNGSAAGMIGWNDPVRAIRGGEPVGLDGSMYTKNFAGVAGWDEGNADAASDDGSEPDGVPNRMGADMVLTAPTVNGTYDIFLVGVGSGPTARGYVATRMIVNVSGGDTVKPFVTSSTPAKGANGVTPNSTVTINFSEPVNCATVNTTNVTMSAGGWTLGTCSGSTATFNTSGQLASTAYTVTVTTAVTDVAGNTLDPANTLNVIGYVTGAAANNNPNVPTALAQYRSDGTTPIAAAGYTNQATVNIAANISDPDGANTVRLHIDLNNDGTEDCTSILYANPRTNAQASCAVVNGTSYDWRVRTADNLGATSAWVAFAGTPDFTVDLTAPVDGTLTPTPGNTQIILNWTAATDATSGVASYTLRRVAGTTPPTDCATGTLVYSGALLTATDPGLTNGADYAYRVCATDNVGWTSIGTTATAQPAAGCTYANPTVTILTAPKLITSDGGFVDYTVQVTNNDTAICGNTTFILSASDTNSTNFYASSLTPITLTVAPGGSELTTLRVTAKANQPNASTTDTTVTSAADANHGAVASTAVTTTINVSAGGCEAEGDYLLSNGDRLSTSR